MFAFDKKPYEIIEKDAIIHDIRRVYPDKVMIVLNSHVKNKQRCGDIVAILTTEEYAQLRRNLPENYSSVFSTIKGINILTEEKENYLGFIT